MTECPPTILALDSATTGCAAALWRDGRVLAAASEAMARGQAQALMPAVAAVLARAGLVPADVDMVAVTRGPGAFTGLRIALAAARGFALALGVPCVGVTTLEAVAHGVPAAERQDRLVLVCVESKREEVYVQLFSSTLEPASEPLACDAAALKGLFAGGERLVLAGDAALRTRAMLAGADLDILMSAASALPDPAHIAAIASARALADAPAPEPLYLRPPDAILPANEGRVRA